MTCVLWPLLSLLLLAGPSAQAEEIGREQAARSLVDADAQTRRDAASRLGEVGTMEDVPLLVKALRDDDEDTRIQAEQALWHVWARSGDPEVDKLYATGIEQMTAGDVEKASPPSLASSSSSPVLPKAGTSAPPCISLSASCASHSPIAMRS